MGDLRMDYEARETIAKVYEFLRIQQEQIHALTSSLDAVLQTLITVDLKTHEKYAVAMEDLEHSAKAEQHAQIIGVIDSVIATLRLGQMGDA